MVKLKRVESWGEWEDRSSLLKYHTVRSIHSAYVNKILSVQVSTNHTEWGEVTHLWVKRHDGKPVGWKDMQRVKNEISGRNRVGIEVYPAEEDLVDEANMYHIWVLPAEFRLPFALRKGKRDARPDNE